MHHDLANIRKNKFLLSIYADNTSKYAESNNFTFHIYLRTIQLYVIVCLYIIHLNCIISV